MNCYSEKKQDTRDQSKTGIPRGVQRGFEQSSGFSFGDVRVHYHSQKPAQLRAHAYTQGNEVYIAPGQEKHLPHELGHVVQQKRGEVKPTGEISGTALNDDPAMESGADRIAARAMSGDPPVQRASWGSQESYNFFAGPMSAAIGLLGIGGGIASYFLGKRNERKHRYIEEIEKYSDAACEAEEEAEEVKYAYDQIDTPTEKAEKGGQLIRAKNKVQRNYETAVDKAVKDGETVQKNQPVPALKDKNIENALKRAYTAKFKADQLADPNNRQAPGGPPDPAPLQATGWFDAFKQGWNEGAPQGQRLKYAFHYMRQPRVDPPPPSQQNEQSDPSEGIELEDLNASQKEEEEQNPHEESRE